VELLRIKAVPAEFVERRMFQNSLRFAKVVVARDAKVYTLGTFHFRLLSILQYRALLILLSPPNARRLAAAGRGNRADAVGSQLQ
jgi:hypothetical protein